MRFKKSYFEENKPVSTKFNQLSELIDGDGTPIEGDFNPGYADIQTGPVAKSFDDNSDYKKGLPTTTDKLAKYAQPRSWWALYYGYGGTPYSHGNKPISESDVAEAIVKKSESTDIVKKNNDLDLEDKMDKIEDLVKKLSISKDIKDKLLNIINDSKNE